MKKVTKSNSNDIRPEDKFIGSQLALARQAAGMTQIEVAEKAGWFKDEFGTPHQQRVSHYENGRRRITLIDFLEYAKAIGTDPEKIIDFGKPRSAKK